ncbi:MAG TPA: hypothetical protein VLA42_07370 [Verrucomicrobiae bacterium]|jgi:hypothetical protein|nr:hypothetical protein [Verrucomicrobiae bacterium]
MNGRISAVLVAMGAMILFAGSATVGAVAQSSSRETKLSAANVQDDRQDSRQDNGQQSGQPQHSDYPRRDDARRDDTGRADDDRARTDERGSDVPKRVNASRCRQTR